VLGAVAVADVGGREHMALLATPGVIGSWCAGHRLVRGSLCTATLLLTAEGRRSTEARYHAQSADERERERERERVDVRERRG
jgi:hypothetical protein